MDQIISFLTLLLLTLLGLVIDIISFIDALLSAALTSIGVPANAQAPLLIIAAILLAVAAFQLLGRLVGVLLIVLFLLLLLHPHMPHEWRHISAPPPSLNLPGQHVTL
jgi:hypothetical protein